MMNCIQISSSVCVCGNGDGYLVLRLHNQPNLFAGESPGWNFEERTIVALICNRTISPSRSHPLQEELNMCRKIGRRILNVIITITIITIIIITITTTIITIIITSPSTDKRCDPAEPRASRASPPSTRTLRRQEPPANTNIQ